jgi:hypothetical protein
MPNRRKSATGKPTTAETANAVSGKERAQQTPKRHSSLGQETATAGRSIHRCGRQRARGRLAACVPGARRQTSRRSPPGWQDWLSRAVARRQQSILFAARAETFPTSHEHGGAVVPSVHWRWCTGRASPARAARDRRSAASDQCLLSPRDGTRNGSGSVRRDQPTDIFVSDHGFR